jgi:hypothetical protein
MSRILFRINLVVASALIALVLLCPLADNAGESPDGLARLIALFARDGTLRRTALASAAGLVVTALLFFRSPGGRPEPPAPGRKSTRPPAIAGA